MNKIFKVFVFSILLFLLTGCNEKTAMDDSAFRNKLSDYEIVDVTDQFEEFSDMIENATVAKCDDWQIEFYVLKSEDYAKGMFEDNRTEFDINVSDNNSSIVNSISNYSIYTLNTDDYYYYLSRIDNTLLYLKVKEEYKDVVKNIVGELGY